ncbi:MAG: glycosyltransferase family 2 protein [Proteobacteria bacterium]|nr:glycosyltransferase family 2 protein [Pseudomonadota bacterium]
MKGQIKKKKIIAVIPAYNEEKHIAKVVRETKKYVDKVIVVDDASTDETGNLARKAGAIVLRHEINIGLGGTLKTGCDGALILGADIIITLDGDGQHDSHEIPKLVNKLIKTKSDAVFGERPFNKTMPFVKKMGNRFFHIFSKYIFGIKVKDTQTGFRIFTSKTYKKIRWESSDYSVASEMLINAENHNLKYMPQEVSTIYYENQKGTTIIDGIKIANKMLNLKFNR